MHKAGNISDLSENMSVGGVKRMIGYGRSECVGDNIISMGYLNKNYLYRKVSNFLQLGSDLFKNLDLWVVQELHYS